MRPASHRDLVPDRHCGNCRFSELPEYTDHLLCFFGDKIEVIPSRFHPDKPTVLLDGEHVGLLEGDSYSEVWAGRVVESLIEVCDEWQPMTEPAA